jgi:hypothetical protein
MGSDAVIYETIFKTTGSDIQNVIVGVHSERHGKHDDFKSVFSFFQSKESRL